MIDDFKGDALRQFSTKPCVVVFCVCEMSAFVELASLIRLIDD